MDVLFAIQRAPTGRAKCKSCLKQIDKGTLRLARTIHMPWMPSRGDRDVYFHLECGARVVHGVVHKGHHIRLKGLAALSGEDLAHVRHIYSPVVPSVFKSRSSHSPLSVDTV